jgi:hypothetical protein
MTGIVERLKRLLGGGAPENAHHHGAHSHAHEHTHEDGTTHTHEHTDEAAPQEAGSEDEHPHQP